MKTSFAAIFFAISFAHASAWAEWLKVYEDDSLAYYADPSTIRRADNIVLLLDLTDYPRPKTIRGLMPYLSMLTQSQFDCQGLRSRWLFASFHVGNMGSGTLVQIASNEPAEDQWQPVVPGSLGEVRMRFACLYWRSAYPPDTARTAPQSRPISMVQYRR